MSLDLAGKRFLIIDDFAEARDSMRQMLHNLGARRLDSSASAEMALQMCRQQRYDIIFCDYMLGAGRKDGQQLLDELRHYKLLRHGCLFIMVSAETSQAGVMGALEHQPDSYLAKPFNQLMLGKRLQRLMRFKQATRSLDQALDDKRLGKARLICEEAISAGAAYSEHFQKQLGQILLQLGELEQARRLYRHILHDRALPWAQLGLAETEYRSEDYTRAERILSGLLDDNPMLLPAYDWLARCQLRLDRPREAQTTLEKAARLSPRAVLRHCELGRLARRNRDSEAAADAYKNAARLALNTIHQNPNNELNWARSLTEVSELPEHNGAATARSQAHRVIGDAVRRYPSDSQLLMNTELLNTRLYSAEQRDREAKAAMAKAERLLAAGDIPVDQDAALDMVRAHKAIGRHDQARQLLQTLTLEDHENQLLRDELEQLGGMAQRETPQQEACREANQRGMSFYLTRDYDAAITAFEEGLAESPDNISINLNLAQALIMRMRQHGVSEDDLERARRALSTGDRLGLSDYRQERHQELKRLFESVDRQAEGSVRDQSA